MQFEGIALDGLEAIKLYRQLYRLGGMRLVGQRASRGPAAVEARKPGRLGHSRTPTAGCLGFRRRARGWSCSSIRRRSCRCLGASESTWRLPGRPTVVESNLISYRHVLGGEAASKLFDLGAQHPRRPSAREHCRLPEVRATSQTRARHQASLISPPRPRSGPRNPGLDVEPGAKGAPRDSHQQGRLARRGTIVLTAASRVASSREKGALSRHLIDPRTRRVLADGRRHSPRDRPPGCWFESKTHPRSSPRRSACRAASARCTPARSARSRGLYRCSNRPSRVAPRDRRDDVRSVADSGRRNEARSASMGRRSCID